MPNAAANDLRRTMATVISSLSNRMTTAEVGRVNLAYSELPQRGVARAVELRRFLAVLGGTWLFRPDGAAADQDNNALADSLGVATSPTTWLSQTTLNRWQGDIIQRGIDKAR